MRSVYKVLYLTLWWLTLPFYVLAGIALVAYDLWEPLRQWPYLRGWNEERHSYSTPLDVSNPCQ